MSNTADQAKTKYAAQKEAASALLEAVTAQVDVVLADGGGTNVVLPKLKLLAETYALVVHGKPE